MTPNLPTMPSGTIRRGTRVAAITTENAGLTARYSQPQTTTGKVIPMEAMSNVTRLPPLRVEGQVTTRPQPMSKQLRVELASNIIAGVLHSMYEAQEHDNPTSHLPNQAGSVQRRYEGIARLAVVPLLEPEQLAVAEQDAIANATSILTQFFKLDAEDLDRHITPEQWEIRMTALVRSALMTYQQSVMRVTR